MQIRLMKGHPALESDIPFLDSLSISSNVRALLENLQPSRSRSGLPKTLSRLEIEKRLDKMIRIYGEAALNQLRDEAKGIAKQLRLQKELNQLDKMISALLGTRKESELISEQVKARSRGLTYDPYRLEFFTTLAAYLNTVLLAKNPTQLHNADAKRHFAFFEAYFSNFIEGTEFEVSEAASIIFQRKMLPNRVDDSHDILGTYKIVADPLEMNICPDTIEKFISLLKHRHGILLESRSEKTPGIFKDKINRAGNTDFVKPDEVVGTLQKRLSREADPAPYVRMLEKAQVFSSAFDFTNYDLVLKRQQQANAFARADEGKLMMPTPFD